jgi:hypothetical protein
MLIFDNEEIGIDGDLLLFFSVLGFPKLLDYLTPCKFPPLVPYSSLSFNPFVGLFPEFEFF